MILYRVSVLLDNVNDRVNILVTDILVLCLDHNADERLCTALANEYPAGVAESFGSSLNGSLNLRISLSRGLILYSYVFK